MKRSNKTLKSRYRQFNFETLEDRRMQSVTPNDMAALASIRPDSAGTIDASFAVSPAAKITSPNPNTSLLTPAQIRSDYGLTPSSPTGSGQTIALIEVGNDPAIQSDVNVFDQKYGLPNLQVNIVPETLGYTPAFDANWARETALDIEYAHVAAPGAKIEVYEANTINDIYTVINTARHDVSVSVISMSFGGNEPVDEQQTYDPILTTPANHQPIQFVVSSGDVGDGAEYPAASPNVLSVGGTKLTQNNGTYQSETAWNDGTGNISSGGPSHYEPKPSFQSAITLSNNRMTPDVAFDASTKSGSGVNVYHSAEGGWVAGGGTSLGAPFWAGMIADADQARVQASKFTLGNVQADVYGFKSSDFNDITSGSSLDFSAKTGYDLVTGLGSPRSQNLIPDLVSTEPNKISINPIGGVGKAGGLTTGSTTSNGVNVPITSGSSTMAVTPAEPLAVDRVFAAESSSNMEPLDSAARRTQALAFDLLMDTSHNDADADQMVDSLFQARSLRTSL